MEISVTTSVPMAAGPVDYLQYMLFEASKQRLVKMTCFGDSREDITVSSGGRYSSWQINNRLRKILGPASELPVIPVNNVWGSASSHAGYCQQTNLPYITTSTDASDRYQPARFPYVTANNVSVGSPFVQLLPTAQSRVTAAKYFNEDSTVKFEPNRSDLVCDIFIRNNASGPDAARWQYAPTNSNEQAPFATAVSNGQVIGNYDANDTGVAKITTAPLAYDPTKPFAQVSIRGEDTGAGNAVTAGLRCYGMRYRHANESRGVVYQTQAIGGSQWTNWLAAIAGTDSETVQAFDLSYDAFAIMGLPDITRFQGGVNDYDGRTIDQIEGDARAFISAYRSYLKQPNHLIILEAPFPRDDGAITTANKQTIDQISGRYYDIAQDTPNVVFLNVAKKLLDRGMDMQSADWSFDAIHLTEFGDFQKTEASIDLMAGESVSDKMERLIGSSRHKWNSDYR